MTSLIFTCLAHRTLNFVSAVLGSPLGRTFSVSAMSKSKAFEFLEVDQPKPFVTHVKLNRPDKRNAMNMKLWMELGEAFDSLAQDQECRSIVLSANGALFTAGIDLKDLMNLGQIVMSDQDVAKKTYQLYRQVKTLQDAITTLEKCHKPVIAAIHNACVGAGVDLITAADIRLCSEDAWFQVKEVEVGLAADVGTLQRLPKVIGSQSLVRELCLTARKFESAEAEKCGLVSKVYPDKERLLEGALAIAERIAQLSPVAVQGTKANLNYARDNSVDDGLEYVARWNATMLQSKDLQDSAMAMLSKSETPPTFAKL